MTSPARGRGRTRIVIVVLVAIFAAAMSTASAAARPIDVPVQPSDVVAPSGVYIPPGTPGPFRIRNPTTDMCLDSNSTYIYYGKCNSSDAGQKWGWWNGGWLISLQTGKCVAPYGDWLPPYLSLGSCWPEPKSLQWVHQNQAIKNELNGNCVHAGPEGNIVFTQSCSTSQFQAWSVTYW
ncbi:RICIN domain-containing protein [Jiangella muralis]|uniref:RICIN domain-containing protein n=1 Tax=Jiangella muralis TaxID=702383 RepID=UPI00069DFD81|nr:RICIN domain-containing protein [Jiangella muralis]